MGTMLVGGQLGCSGSYRYVIKHGYHAGRGVVRVLGLIQVCHQTWVPCWQGGSQGARAHTGMSSNMGTMLVGGQLGCWGSYRYVIKHGYHADRGVVRVLGLIQVRHQTWVPCWQGGSQGAGAHTGTTSNMGTMLVGGQLGCQGSYRYVIKHGYHAGRGVVRVLGLIQVRHQTWVPCWQGGSQGAGAHTGTSSNMGTMLVGEQLGCWGSYRYVIKHGYHAGRGVVRVLGLIQVCHQTCVPCWQGGSQGAGAHTGTSSNMGTMLVGGQLGCWGSYRYDIKHGYHAGRGVVRVLGLIQVRHQTWVPCWQGGSQGAGAHTGTSSNMGTMLVGGQLGCQGSYRYVIKHGYHAGRGVVRVLGLIQVRHQTWVPCWQGGSQGAGAHTGMSSNMGTMLVGGQLGCWGSYRYVIKHWFHAGRGVVRVLGLIQVRHQTWVPCWQGGNQGARAHTGMSSNMGTMLVGGQLGCQGSYSYVIKHGYHAGRGVVRVLGLIQVCHQTWVPCWQGSSQGAGAHTGTSSNMGTMLVGGQLGCWGSYRYVIKHGYHAGRGVVRVLGLIQVRHQTWVPCWQGGSQGAGAHTGTSSNMGTMLVRGVVRVLGLIQVCHQTWVPCWQGGSQGAGAHTGTSSDMGTMLVGGQLGCWGSYRYVIKHGYHAGRGVVRVLGLIQVRHQTWVPCWQGGNQGAGAHIGTSSNMGTMLVGGQLGCQGSYRYVIKHGYHAGRRVVRVLGLIQVCHQTWVPCWQGGSQGAGAHTGTSSNMGTMLVGGQLGCQGSYRYVIKHGYHAGRGVVRVLGLIQVCHQTWVPCWQGGSQGAGAHTGMSSNMGTMLVGGQLGCWGSYRYVIKHGYHAGRGVVRVLGLIQVRHQTWVPCWQGGSQGAGAHTGTSSNMGTMLVGGSQGAGAHTGMSSNMGTMLVGGQLGCQGSCRYVIKHGYHAGRGAVRVLGLIQVRHQTWVPCWQGGSQGAGAHTGMSSNMGTMLVGGQLGCWGSYRYVIKHGYHAGRGQLGCQGSYRYVIKHWYHAGRGVVRVLGLIQVRHQTWVPCWQGGQLGCWGSYRYVIKHGYHAGRGVVRVLGLIQVRHQTWVPCWQGGSQGAGAHTGTSSNMGTMLVGGQLGCWGSYRYVIKHGYHAGRGGSQGAGAHTGTSSNMGTMLVGGQLGCWGSYRYVIKHGYHAGRGVVRVLGLIQVCHQTWVPCWQGGSQGAGAHTGMSSNMGTMLVGGQLGCWGTYRYVIKHVYHAGRGVVRVLGLIQVRHQTWVTCWQGGQLGCWGSYRYVIKHGYHAGRGVVRVLGLIQVCHQTWVPCWQGGSQGAGAHTGTSSNMGTMLVGGQLGCWGSYRYVIKHGYHAGRGVVRVLGLIQVCHQTWVPCWQGVVRVLGLIQVRHQTWVPCWQGGSQGAGAHTGMSSNMGTMLVGGQLGCWGSYRYVIKHGYHAGRGVVRVLGLIQVRHQTWVPCWQGGSQGAGAHTGMSSNMGTMLVGGQLGCWGSYRYVIKHGYHAGRGVVRVLGLIQVCHQTWVPCWQGGSQGAGAHTGTSSNMCTMLVGGQLGCQGSYRYVIKHGYHAGRGGSQGAGAHTGTSSNMGTMLVGGQLGCQGSYRYVIKHGYHAGRGVVRVLGLIQVRHQTWVPCWQGGSQGAGAHTGMSSNMGTMLVGGQLGCWGSYRYVIKHGYHAGRGVVRVLGLIQVRHQTWVPCWQGGSQGAGAHTGMSSNMGTMLVGGQLGCWGSYRYVIKHGCHAGRGAVRVLGLIQVRHQTWVPCWQGGSQGARAHTGMSSNMGTMLVGGQLGCQGSCRYVIKHGYHAGRGVVRVLGLIQVCHQTWVPCWQGGSQGAGAHTGMSSNMGTMLVGGQLGCWGSYRYVIKHGYHAGRGVVRVLGLIQVRHQTWVPCWQGSSQGARAHTGMSSNMGTMLVGGQLGCQGSYRYVIKHGYHAGRGGSQGAGAHTGTSSNMGTMLVGGQLGCWGSYRYVIKHGYHAGRGQLGCWGSYRYVIKHGYHAGRGVVSVLGLIQVRHQTWVPCWQGVVRVLGLRYVISQTVEQKMNRRCKLTH